METPTDFWRKCSTCKKPIGFSTKYYVCSVSTCNGQRTGYIFCSYQCFESHVPGARHRDAAGVQKMSPTRAEAESAAKATTSSPEAAAAAPRRLSATTASSSMSVSKSTTPREVLIIASRLKDYIQARGDMNTSAAVMDVLSDYVRVLCDRAMDVARGDGRKTVMDRDFDFLKDSVS